jgi:hypothetical protein
MFEHYGTRGRPEFIRDALILSLWGLAGLAIATIAYFTG